MTPEQYAGIVLVCTRDARPRRVITYVDVRRAVIDTSAGCWQFLYTGDSLFVGIPNEEAKT